MELNVGDSYKCPEGHKAKIVWISADNKVIAIRCSQKHLRKVVKIADHAKPAPPYGRNPKKEKKIYVKNMVFLIEIE